ncbi:cell wall hydrolase [Azospirillum sp. ST 5-10]|uniref:cell wall hydrolase n=1 Tax=unclassified Azospirillum TaxID=2630922 RepID=UPI003F4A31BE
MNRRLVPIPGGPAAGGPPPRRPDEEAVDTLARTLWGEARGEPVRGIEAVAAVVLNRVRVAQARGGFWWGGDVVAVCRKPWQFSCWNADDPNRAKLLAVTADDPVFATCLRVARRAVTGTLPDPTDGATHYHRAGVTPSWTLGHAPCAEIGHHLFYNDVE